MKKVFCENCKYHREEDIDGFVYQEYCISNYTYKDTPVKRYKVYKICKVKNKDNKCKEFEPSLFYKIEMFFKKGEEE